MQIAIDGRQKVQEQTEKALESMLSQLFQELQARLKGASAPTGSPAGTRPIVEGDTLSEIARQENTTVAELMRLNPQIKDPNLIYAGDTLNLPSNSQSGGVDSKSGQNGSGVTNPAVVNASAGGGQKTEAASQGSAGSASLNGGGNAIDQAFNLIKEKEGFRSTPYWDVNALRAGYGSDTVTDANGKVSRVTAGTVVSEADAARDLKRRIAEFENVAKGQVGAANWDRLADNVKAGLISIAYNYGSLPSRIVDDVAGGQPEQIAKAVEGLQYDDGGINRRRRLDEAALIRKLPA